MKRLRMAVLSAVASLAFIPGCCCYSGYTSDGGGFLQRMHPCPKSCPSCPGECSSCEAMSMEGPILGEPCGPCMGGPPAVQDLGQPRVQPKTPYAQPDVAGPTSMTKTK
jgi:hypothetical protein